MYPVEYVYLEGIPWERRISETTRVHPVIQQHLIDSGYHTLHEKQVFRLRYTGYRISLRVDIIAFKDDEVLIVECKGSPFRKANVFGALMQITLYMRFYRMLQTESNPQLLLLHDLNPELIVPDYHVKGVLAIPYVTESLKRRNAFQTAYESLKKVDLIEDDLTIWDLRPSKNSAATRNRV